MGKKNKDEDATEEGGGKGKGKSKLLIIGVLCIALAGAGFVLGGKLGGDPAAPAATVPFEPTVRHIIELDAVNVNLAQGHYLRIKIAIGADNEPPGPGEEIVEPKEGEESEYTLKTAPAADLVLTTFAGRTMQELNTPAGREKGRTDLLAGLKEYYGDHIVSVMFTEFVMQ